MESIMLVLIRLMKGILPWSQAWRSNKVNFQNLDQSQKYVIQSKNNKEDNLLNLRNKVKNKV